MFDIKPSKSGEAWLNSYRYGCSIRHVGRRNESNRCGNQFDLIISREDIRRLWVIQIQHASYRITPKVTAGEERTLMFKPNRAEPSRSPSCSAGVRNSDHAKVAPSEKTICGSNDVGRSQMIHKSLNVNTRLPHCSSDSNASYMPEFLGMPSTVWQ